MGLINRRDFLAYIAIAAGGAGVNWAMSSGRVKRVRDISHLAQKPPMGWNSFDSYGVYLHEKAASANAEAMAKKLKPFGYEYFVVDNGWFGEYKMIPGTIYAAEKHASDVKINEYGLLQPSDTYFPNGLKLLIDKVHALGLKFGVHLMRGIPRKAVEQNLPIKGTKYRAQDIADKSSICKWCAYNYGVNMDKPGGQEFYNSLVNQLADWGIDYIKADDIVPHPKEVVAMVNAIEQCPRDMVLSLSPGGSVNPEAIDSFRRANLLRVTHDIWDEQNGIDQCFDAWRKWQGKERPGFWIDMDMVPFGMLGLMSPPEYVSAKGFAGEKDEKEGLVALSGKGTTRQSLFTRDQMFTFITLRALSASPLMMGGDLPTLDKFSLRLLTDKEMLACNQNGVMGHLVSEDDGFEIWQTPEKGAKDKGWVGIFNRRQETGMVTVDNKKLGLDVKNKYVFKDVWKDRDILSDGSEQSIRVTGYGALFIRYHG